MSTAQELKDLGNQQYKAKDYQKAIDLYTQAFELDSTNVSILSNRSACHYLLGQYQEAHDDAKQCITIDPEFQKGYARQVNALIKLEKKDEAKQVCEEALKKYPEDKLLKQAQDSLNAPPFDFQQLLQNPMIQQMLQKNPQLLQQFMKNPQMFQNPQFMNMMSQMMQNQAPPQAQQNQQNSQFTNNQFTNQQQQFTQPPHQTQTPPQPQTNQQEPKKEEEVKEVSEFDQTKSEAGKHYLKKEFEKAIELYEKCSKIDSLNLIVRNNKAACLIELKKIDEALTVVNEAIKIYNDCEFEKRNYEHLAKVLARKARIYHLKGDYEQAIKTYEDSLLEKHVNKVSAALRELKREKKRKEDEAYINPELCDQHREKGNEFYKAQKYPQALKEYEEAQKRNPKDIKVKSNLSAVLIKLMKFNEAMQYCDTVLEMDPQNIKSMNRKGKIYTFNKEYHKAIEIYKKALELDANNVQAQQGIQQTQMKISQGMQGGNDEERVRRAMADPEIARIMQDPMLRIALEQMQKDPKKAQEFFKDPNLAPKIQKLMQAGILRMG